MFDLTDYGIDTENGGCYRIDGRRYDLRGRFTIDEFGGDRSAYVAYFVLRQRELYALTDAITQHNSEVFARAFARAVRPKRRRKKTSKRRTGFQA